jgi:hypothetical protein
VTNPDGSAVADLSGYRVFYATYSLLGMTPAQALASSTVNKVVVPAPSTATALSGLPAGTPYFIRFTAFDVFGNESGFNVNGTGQDVEVSTITPAAVIARSLTTLAASPVSATRIDLQWTPDPLGNQDGFRIEWSADPSFTPSTVVMLANPQARTYQVNNLSSGVQYYFRVSAYNGLGASSAMNAGAQTLGTLNVPAGLKQAFAFPNPAVGRDPVIRAMMGSVEAVEVTIFDQAGRVVHSDRVTQMTTVNGQPACDYVWKGPHASGVYYAVIHGKSGSKTIRARTSFAVVQ